MTTNLFAPLTLGHLDLPNRVVMAPMTRCRATTDHVPTPVMAEYYAQRAGAGLIVTEGIAPDGHGCGYARIPGLWSKEQVVGWKTVTDAVHAAGGRIAAQLMHTGRVGHPLNMPEGAELLGPSAVAAPGEMYTDQQGPQPHPTPRAMTASEVKQAIQAYVTAAEHAVAAGFDMVELHGANGYLIDQFFTPGVNVRDDAWGGSVEGRGRFALAVADAVVAAIGAERTGIRLSPRGAFNGITPWDEGGTDFTWLAGELGKRSLAYLHVVDHSSMGAPEPGDELKQAMRDAFGGPIVLSGGYDGDRANADLAAGRGELVAFGRPYIANPDLVARLRDGAELAEPDHTTFYTPGAAGYTDYAALGA